MKMNGSIFVLGRDSDISLSEIRSLYKDSHNIEILSPQVCYVDINSEEVDFARIGGSIKLARLISVNKSSENYEQLLYFTSSVLEKLTEDNNSKINLGISIYQSNLSLKNLNKFKMDLKNHLKSTGKSIRLIPNSSMSLSSAQTFHNNLDRKNNVELIIVYSQHSYYISQVTAVQDIDDYFNRDRMRPKRDTRVGMLPPKLAQIMINLASVKLKTINGSEAPLLLDPFCGTGVVLQEAQLMGYRIMGTDLSEKMVAYTKENINWLSAEYHLNRNLAFFFDVGDATNYRWPERPNLVVSEVYLGPPLTQKPSLDMIHKYRDDCQTIFKMFLSNLANQLNSGAVLCLAVPAWRFKDIFVGLTIVDQLNDLGYNQVKFESVNQLPLIYHRQGQFVARQLLVLEKI